MTDPTDSRGVVDECMEEETNGMVGVAHGPQCRQT